MDPVSSAASLLTLVESAFVVGKATRDLIRDLRDAPAELTWLSSRILASRAQLQQLVRLQNGALSGPGREGELLIPPEELVPFREAVGAVEQCLRGIEKAVAIGACGDKFEGKRRALRWVLNDKRTVKKLVGHLKDVEGSFTAALGMISVLGSNFAMAGENGKAYPL